jgi:hypothetical protein
MALSTSDARPETRAVQVFSLAGLGRWLRLCDEAITAQGKRVCPEVHTARAEVIAELRTRGIEV